MRILILLSLIAVAPAIGAQQPVVAPNAPKDQPVDTHTRCQWDSAVKAMQPYVDKAHSTWPAAKARFLAGLPPRHTFFVTTRLTDQFGHFEQVFVAPDSIIGDRISGRIWSDITAVRGYARGQRYSFNERDLVDWMVARPDGSEEGNVVGVFMDTYRPPAC